MTYYGKPTAGILKKSVFNIILTYEHILQVSLYLHLGIN